MFRECLLLLPFQILRLAGAGRFLADDDPGLLKLYAGVVEDDTSGFITSYEPFESIWPLTGRILGQTVLVTLASAPDKKACYFALHEKKVVS